MNEQVETEAERRAEIPIVQLNPGGILNWKYKVRGFYFVCPSMAAGLEMDAHAQIGTISFLCPTARTL